MKTAQPDRTEPPSRATEGPRSLMRILRLLELLAQSDRPMTLAELSLALDCPKSSLLVLLRPLAEMGYLTRERDSYLLGPQSFQFAQQILASDPFETVLARVMTELVRQTGETVLFAARQGDRAVYVSVIESPQAVRYVAQRGISRPLYCSASGLVMLAHETPEALEAYLARTELAPLTERTVTSKPALRRLIAEVQRTGYSSTEGTVHQDAAGLGVPVLGGDGRLAGVLIIGAPVERAARNRALSLEAALAAASQLTLALTVRPGRSLPAGPPSADPGPAQ